MANPTTYGTTLATFGVTPLTGFVVQSTTLTTKCNVFNQVMNENGQLVTQRFDDQSNELSLDMIVSSGSAPVPGQLLTYNALLYAILNVDYKTSNKDFPRVTVKCQSSQYLTL